MMKALRRHTKVVLIFVIVAFLSTIFLVWGMNAGQKSAFNEKNAAAVVNGQAISYEVFAQRWSQVLQYRQVAHLQLRG